MKSPKFSFKGTGNKILKSFLLSLLAFLCTWGLANYSSFSILEQYPMFGAFVPFLLNALLKFTNKENV